MPKILTLMRSHGLGVVQLLFELRNFTKPYTPLFLNERGYSTCLL